MPQYTGVCRCSGQIVFMEKMNTAFAVNIVVVQRTGTKRKPHPIKSNKNNNSKVT